MKKKRKMSSHIIAVMSLVVFAVLGLASASAPDEIYFDATTPDEQLATLVVPGGTFDVFEFAGKPVGWFKVSLLKSTIVKIPSGIHKVKFNYYFGGNDNYKAEHFKDRELTFDFKAGNVYELIHTENTGFFGDGRFSFFVIDVTPGVTDCFLTVTGLEEFNGKYILFTAYSETYNYARGVKGMLEKNNFLGVLVENGKAEIPIYTYLKTLNNYYGRNTLSYVDFYLNDEEIFTNKNLKGRANFQIDKITLTNGKATIDKSDLKTK